MSIRCQEVVVVLRGSVDALCLSGAKKLSLYEEVLRQVRYVNSEPQELNSRTFVLSCTELNGRFVTNKLHTTVITHTLSLSLSLAVRLSACLPSCLFLSD